MCKSMLLWAALTMAALSVSCSTPGDSTTGPSVHADQAAQGMYIEPQAAQALRAMSDTLGSAKAFGFHVSAQVDEMSPTGKMVQEARETKVLVRRPDAFIAHAQSGDDQWTLCYKGKKLSAYRKDRNECSTIDVPDSIEKTLDFLFDKYGMEIPLADLLFQNPYDSLTENVQTGVYLGLHTVRDRPCHHLLFTQEKVDWQVWIDSGEKALPLKMVITRKTEPGDPQYTAELTDWDLAPARLDSAFDFKAPAGAKAVDMTELRSEKGK